jgi:hypothetical protein
MTMPIKLAALLVLAGCADHPGAYLEVKGGSITFDHVEFYFGSQIGTTFGTPTQSDVKGVVYRRQLADSDLSVAATSGAASDLTYYVPASNTGLGDYVMAIATRGGTPVGIGDVANFTVPGKGYSIVDITLEDYDNVETWQNGCVAWDRKHGREPVAFVDADDRDCDGEVSARDCDDAAFCHPEDTSCQPARELCESNTCAYGCMIDSNCVPRVCVPSFTCTNVSCDNAPTLLDKFNCLSNASGADHPQYSIGASAGEPCSDAMVTIQLPSNRQCTNPYIEFQQSAGGWTFAVADDHNGACVLTLIAVSSTTPFGMDRHVLISMDPLNPQDPRPTIFVGIEPDSGGCTHTTAPMGTLQISDCQ